MTVSMLDPALLQKQQRGLPLTHMEARTAVLELNTFVRQDDGDKTAGVLLLAMIGSLYFEDVWDLLILEAKL